MSQALALLSDYIDKEDPFVRIGAIMGLGIAYAGSQNEQVTMVLSGLYDPTVLGIYISYCLIS